MEELRRCDRRRTFKAGKVVFNHGFSVIDCLVHNQSPGGAKLRFSQPTVLPAQVELLIPSDGTRTPVRLVWQHGANIGVEFAK